MIVGFVPSMYVEQVMCENREKRRRSTKLNYQRIIYEFVENGNLENFEVMLDDKSRNFSKFNRNDF